MARYLDQISQIGGTIEQIAGADMRQKVMEGSDQIKGSSSPQKVAHWVNGAMERLDTLVDEPVRNQIM
jgi:hypothetical protein